MEHEPSASGKGYWVHIPNTKKKNFGYNTYEDFKKDFPKEAKLFYGWHPKGGSFLFNRDIMGSDFDGLMVKFRKK